LAPSSSEDAGMAQSDPHAKSGALSLPPRVWRRLGLLNHLGEFPPISLEAGEDSGLPKVVGEGAGLRVF
jgi:hypothetical protein